MRINTMKIQDRTGWMKDTGLKSKILMNQQLEESQEIWFLCMITAVYFMYKDGKFWRYLQWRNG